MRLCIRAIVVLGIVVGTVALPVATMAFTFATPSTTAMPTNSIWSLDGGLHMTAYRGAVEDDANFGVGGLVGVDVSFTVLTTIDAASLSGFDGFIAPFWSDNDVSAATASAITDFFLNGGHLLILQDHPNFDAVGAALGLPALSTNLVYTQSMGSGPPLVDGPFGTASPVTHNGSWSHLDAGTVASTGGQAALTNAAGEIGAAWWEPGAFSATSGALVIVGDSELFSTAAGSASYAPLNANGTFALNTTAYLVTVPEPGSGLLLAAGLFAIARRRRGASVRR
jgi:hypothetical protein